MRRHRVREILCKGDQRIRAAQRRPPVIRDIGGVRDVVEGRLRDDVQRIDAWEKLTEREVVSLALQFGESRYLLTPPLYNSLSTPFAAI